jgi:hypothetical protein
MPWDDEKGRYLGLQAGEAVQASVDATSVLVKPGVARRQLDEDARAAGKEAEVEPRDEVSVEDGGAAATISAPKRFYAAVELDPMRLSRDASQVADEVVKHLAALVDTDLEVRLEISANRAGGFPDDVVRTVTENAKTLKFDQHGFEER